MRRRETSLPESGKLPGAIRLANTFLRPFNTRIEERLSVESLIAEAKRRTGLDELGSGDIRRPLEVLLDSVRREARLHPLGWRIIRSRLLGILENRLRAQYWFFRYPEILNQNVDPPIVITGLQRTGTTLLQRLLAADPQVRSVRSWEGLNPAPPLPGARGLATRIDGQPVKLMRPPGPGGSDSRIRSARLTEQALKLLVREYFIIHPVEHDGPEEEVLLLDNALMSTVPEALMYVPSFSRWLERQDQSSAYEQLAALLKLLQWQDRRRYWVLKSPHHLEWPEQLAAHLPHARIIMTHRDPVVATSSFYSMIWHNNRLLSQSTPPELLARHWFHKQRRMLARFLEYRDNAERAEAPTREIVDVSYYDLIADPIRVVRHLYERFGLDLTREKEERMRTVLRHHGRDRYGVHRYHLESFGISRGELEAAFAEYRERFGISRERTS